MAAAASAEEVERPDVDLVVALPRPQALKRVLQYGATMGVGRIDLIRTWRPDRVEIDALGPPSSIPKVIARLDAAEKAVLESGRERPPCVLRRQAPGTSI